VRVLADENMPHEAVAAMRAAGHDVAWIAEDAPSIVDLDVLTRAFNEERVLVTGDKDFGELAFTTAPDLAVYGVVLLRAYRSDAIAELAVSTLATHPEMRGEFVVVEPGREPRVRAIVVP
jgi:predicted nuclease of predicted toxin-antitoxin system